MVGLIANRCLRKEPALGEEHRLATREWQKSSLSNMYLSVHVLHVKGCME